MLQKDLTILFLLLSWLYACQREDKENFLPSAKGEKGEIILVMDSIKWQETLGKTIQNIFSEPQYGLPQPEPMYTLRYIKPRKFYGLLKQHKNIILAITLDTPQSSDTRLLKSLFTKKSFKQIIQNSKNFQINLKNLYAKGQEVMCLFGKNDEILVKNLIKKKEKIQRYFHQIEKERLIKAIKKNSNKALSEKIYMHHKMQICIPNGFQVAKHTENFIWFRHPEVIFDKNLFIAFKSYHSEDQFDSSHIIHWRNQIAQSHLYGNPENPNSYIITETLIPPLLREINFKENYAIESRGLWRTKNISMGGAFISYTFYNPNSTKLCYMEGFLFAPGTKKRELIRELEAILWTLKL